VRGNAGPRQSDGRTRVAADGELIANAVAQRHAGRNLHGRLLHRVRRDLSAQDHDAMSRVDPDDIGRGALVLSEGIRDGAYHLWIGYQLVANRSDLRHALHQHTGDQLLGHRSYAPAPANLVAVDVDADFAV